MVAQVNQTSSPDVLSTLQWMRARGIKPVALHYASKAALNKEYASPNYSPPPDTVWRNQNLNIGGLLGPLMGGPLDVDLDCREAMFFAPKFLPKTSAVFGRKSKPESHYIYKVSCTEYAKVAFSDPETLDTIVEVRGDGGHQSVFPGSVHQGSGERIQWASVPLPDIPIVDEKILTRATKNIAIATLIVRHIWTEGSRNEANKHLAGILYNLEWTLDETIYLIEQVQAYCGDDDKTRIATIKATYAKGDKGQKLTGAPSLRKLLSSAKIVDKILEWAGSATINLMNEYNERFAVVDLAGRMRIIGFPEGAREDHTFYTTDDFVALYGTDRILVGDKDIPKCKIWLNSPNRKQYRRIDFYPGGGEPPRVLNMWQGWAVEPDDGSSCAAWLELLRDVICGGDPELSNWLLHWFAAIVRKPAIKTRTSPVIIGIEGAGKTLLVEYFGAILGSAYTTVTNEEHITGKFNRHLATTLLLHSDEALYGGEKKHRGIIRALISDSVRMMEAKGIDAVAMKNFVRLILTSNEPNAAPTTLTDRRFTVFDVSKRKAPRELISRVVAEYEGQGPAALLNYLMAMDFDIAIPAVNVKNDALLGMKQHNLGPIETWLQDRLMDGVLMPDTLRWAQHDQTLDWPVVVGVSGLHVSFKLFCEGMRISRVPSTHALMRVLRDILQDPLKTRSSRFPAHLKPSHAPRQVSELSEVQAAITNLPDLRVCRELFARHIQSEIEWPDDRLENEKLPWDKI